MPTGFVPAPPPDTSLGDVSLAVPLADPTVPWLRDASALSLRDATAPSRSEATASMRSAMPGEAENGGERPPEQRATAEMPRVLGPLADHLADPRVTDVFVNGDAGLWVDRGSGPRRDALWTADERSVRALAVELVAAGGRHLDEATPCVDVQVVSGRRVLRVHAVLPPVSTGGTLLSIRVPREDRPRLEELAAGGAFARCGGVEWLRDAVRRRRNLLITGAAGTGKTTLLAALLAAASGSERIVTVEDVAELRIAHPHHVALEARQANLEGAGAIALDRLVREALRMRPDRLVVGECRGAEVRELLSALNTGHDGGAGTLHANGLDDVPARVEALGALAGWDATTVARQTVSAFDLVLHLSREPGGARVLDRVGVFTVVEGRLAIREVRPWED